MKKGRAMTDRVRIRHNKGILAIIIILIVFLVILSYLSKDENGEVECYTDSDCARLETTCCSCKMGGEEICVSVNNASVYAAKDCPEPEKLFCSAFYNCKDQECVCKYGKCMWG